MRVVNLVDAAVAQAEAACYGVNLAGRKVCGVGFSEAPLKEPGGISAARFRFRLWVRVPVLSVDRVPVLSVGSGAGFVCGSGVGFVCGSGCRFCLWVLVPVLSVGPVPVLSVGPGAGLKLGFQIGTGQYFWMNAGSRCLDSHGGRRRSFLLWGEPGAGGRSGVTPRKPEMTAGFYRRVVSTSFSQSGGLRISRGLGPSAGPTIPSRSIMSIRWAARP